MSESLEVTISLKLNGDEIKGLGFPINRRLEVDEVQALGPSEKANDGNDTTFTAVAIGDVDSVQALFYQVIDQAGGVRLEGGEATNVAVRLNAGGFVLIFGATGITDTNITDNNNSGSTLKKRVLAGGT